MSRQPFRPTLRSKSMRLMARPNTPIPIKASALLALTLVVGLVAGPLVSIVHFGATPHFQCDHGRLAHGTPESCGGSDHSHEPAEANASRSSDPRVRSLVFRRSIEPQQRDGGSGCPSERRAPTPPTLSERPAEASHDHCPALAWGRPDGVSVDVDPEFTPTVHRAAPLVSPSSFAIAGPKLYRLAPKQSPPALLVAA